MGARSRCFCESPTIISRDSATEWSGSSKMRASGSVKTLIASSNDSPCLTWFVRALCASHSKLKFIRQPPPYHTCRFLVLPLSVRADTKGSEILTAFRGKTPDLFVCSEPGQAYQRSVPAHTLSIGGDVADSQLRASHRKAKAQVEVASRKDTKLNWSVLNLSLNIFLIRGCFGLSEKL